MGKIKRWNDPQLQVLNKGIKLPNLPIVVVHRSDGSGTTYIFTDFLSTISPQWAKQVGRGKSVNWPVGIGGKGNEAVAENVRNTVGAIGYVELAYVLQTNMAYGYVKNRAGEYLLPSPATVAVAASKKPGVTSKNFSIVWEPGAKSYPISGYSWVLLYRNQPNVATKNAVVHLFNWMEGAGQAQAASVDYVPLPANVRAQAHHLLDTLR
jgi:phosphate transport system substrate-binding protein